MESKWAKADKRTDETKFPNRDTVVDFMNVMLQHKFFHRVKTIIVKKEIKKKPENESNDEARETSKKGATVDKSPEPKKSSKKEKKEKKEKKKVKFDMHPEQLFLDSNEVSDNLIFFISLLLCCVFLMLAVRVDLRLHPNENLAHRRRPGFCCHCRLPISSLAPNGSQLRLLS